MKLKYNHGGEVREIPLTTDKPQGKRLAVRKNGQTWYAPLVSVTDSTASNFRLVFGGEVCALAATPTLQPEISSVTVTPSYLSQCVGTTGTATITAVANEAVQSVTYELNNSPSWITLDEDIILISPTPDDADTTTNVDVIARDTGSTAQADTTLSVYAKKILTNLQHPFKYDLNRNGYHCSLESGSSGTATLSFTLKSNNPAPITISGGMPSLQSSTYSGDARNATVALVYYKKAVSVTSTYSIIKIQQSATDYYYGYSLSVGIHTPKNNQWFQMTIPGAS